MKRIGWKTDESRSNGYEVSANYEGAATTVHAAPPARGSAEQEPAEFERFQDLTSKLLTVPKSELDEQREKG